MEFDTAEWVRHKLYQPIQILYFEKDKLVSWHVNCTAPSHGFNLNWNYDQRFETFPPISPLNCDSINITLRQYKGVYPEISGNKDFTVLIFWTNVLAKVSQSAIKTTFENINKFHKNNLCDVFLINDDNFLIEMSEEKGNQQ